MQTYFFLSRKRENAKGLCPIYCRITNGVERADFSTGIFIEPENWGNAWPLCNIRETQNRLSAISEKVYSIIADCERQDIYDPNAVILRYACRRKPAAPRTLLEIADELLSVECPSHYITNKIRIAVKRFEAVTGCTAASDITVETLRGFSNLVVQGEKPLMPSTRHKHLEIIKRVFRFAENKEYIRRSPFHFYKIPRPAKSDPVQLNAFELTALEKHNFASNRLNHVKDLFLFQCYTGLSYADLSRFNLGNLYEKDGQCFLKGDRAKNNESYYLPFIPFAVAIADKYSYRLPLLTNQKYNAYLKEVAEVIGINKIVTTHVGRRTFAQIMIDMGYSQEAVARMMGHESFKMTARHYARISEARVQLEATKIHAPQIFKLPSVPEWKQVV